ncbi:MAG: hypothetical protein PF508_03525 [Spirochaeta sp.]|nr:hypothetical protein [Spirochaeta sp.]
MAPIRPMRSATRPTTQGARNEYGQQSCQGGHQAAAKEQRMRPHRFHQS